MQTHDGLHFTSEKACVTFGSNLEQKHRQTKISKASGFTWYCVSTEEQPKE